MEKFEVVKAYWAAEEAGDLARVLSHFHEDATFVFPGLELRGREAIRTYYERVIAENVELRVTPTNTIEQGSQIVVEYTCRIVGRSGGVTEAHGCNVFTIDAGQIRRLRSYFIPDITTGED